MSLQRKLLPGPTQAWWAGGTGSPSAASWRSLPTKPEMVKCVEIGYWPPVVSRAFCHSKKYRFPPPPLNFHCSHTSSVRIGACFSVSGGFGQWSSRWRGCLSVSRHSEITGIHVHLQNRCGAQDPPTKKKYNYCMLIQGMHISMDSLGWARSPKKTSKLKLN